MSISQMISPVFSVVVPAYNMGRYIGAALESVAAQSVRCWEVIVVDDCAPDDGTSKIVQEFAARHPDQRIEFIRHEVNTGVSGARNTAIEAAKGEFLAFLDPDDFWLSGYLAAVHAKIDRDESIDVVGTPPIAFWEIPGRPNMKPDVVRFENWQIGQFPASLALGNFLQPSSTVVRRKSVQAVGGFVTDREFQHIEDYDLWIRLAQDGAKFDFVNENLTKYRKHPAAATSDIRRMDELHERLAMRHAGFFINSQRHMLSVMMRDFRSMRRSLKSPLRKVLEVLRRR